MQRLAGFTLLFFALAMSVFGVTAATGETGHAAKYKDCQSAFTEGRTARLLRVTNVSCATGRKVAQRIASRPPGGCVNYTDKKGHLAFVKPCAKAGYRCTGRPIAARLALSVKCTRGARVVSFQY
jgi:hypothetical protein